MSKSYIIAIAPFEQPNGFDVGNEGILATLYGELFNRNNIDYDYIDGIIKENDAKVPLGYFKNPDYKEVSAVLFSCLATMGKVDAVGDDPFCTFEHSRINKNGNMPTQRLTTRIQLSETVREMYGDDETIEFDFYRETITDGLCLYINPFAEHPLKRKTILEMYNAGVNIYYYNLEDMDFDEILVHDDSLVHRLVHKLVQR